MYVPTRSTKVPWKCDYCGAKYLVTLSTLYDANNETTPCNACGQTMHWTKSQRTPSSVEPLFDAGQDPQRP